MRYKLKYIFTLCTLFVTISAVAQTDIDRRRYIEQYAELAMDQQAKYGIPASITLAQGLLESANGKSRLAVEANNHFGIKCKEEWTGGKIYHDDDELQECFRAYKTAEESYIDHSLFLTTRPRYAKLFTLDITDYKGWAHGLKEAGYATNPVYAQSLIKIIEDYNLYDFDTPAPKAEPVKKPRRQRSQEELDAVGRIAFNPEALNVKPAQNPAVFIANGTIDIDHHTVALFSAGKYALRSNNGCRYVVAEAGDTMADVAAAVGSTPKRLGKINELNSATTFSRTTLIYIDRKKSSYGLNAVHVVEQSETIHDVAQYYAIRLDKLKELNKNVKDPLAVGQHITLSQTN
ncbi:MAG: glucosaminidase domain-containing protein [Tidjanibacter sp.]|nr:glucosaminidase domain-containing protein [Tidjanibacter sp.]